MPARDCATLVDLLRRRARERPDAPGYVFLPDGGPEELRLTWSELDERARAMLNYLHPRDLTLPLKR